MSELAGGFVGIDPDVTSNRVAPFVHSGTFVSTRAGYEGHGSMLCVFTHGVK